MIFTSAVNRLALVVALILAAGIVWVGLRDSEPLLIVLGPALLVVSALIRGGAASAVGAMRGPVPRTALLTPPSNQVEALTLAGKKIAAIKQYRDETGAGLKEAKDAVEALERQIRLPER